MNKCIPIFFPVLVSFCSRFKTQEKERGKEGERERKGGREGGEEREDLIEFSHVPIP